MVDRVEPGRYRVGRIESTPGHGGPRPCECGEYGVIRGDMTSSAP